MNRLPQQAHAALRAKVGQLIISVSCAPGGGGRAYFYVLNSVLLCLIQIV